MELRAFRYFVEVVKQKSFTVAAEHMFVTQPTHQQDGQGAGR